MAAKVSASLTLHAVQERGMQTRRGERPGQSERNAERRQTHGLADDEA